jgi:FeS assembly SUF system protein
MENNLLQLEEEIVKRLRTVYDPEIPVNIYDLGLIYNIETTPEGIVNIELTMTAPGCPMSDFILDDIRMKIESIEGVSSLNLNLTFDPPWDKDMMSDEAKLELGYL